MDVTIDSLAAGGDGVGRLPDGRVVFVPFTAPGDRARLQIHEDRKRFARASLVALQEESPARCEPVCPVFGRCGGCAWQHIRYEDQLEAKRKILRDALTRIGRLEVPALPPIVASPDAYHYRARTRVLLQGGLLGYRRRRSHQLCAIRSCPVLTPEVDELLSQMAEEPESWTSSDGHGAERDLATPPRSASQEVEEEWEICAGSSGPARAFRVPPAEGEGQARRKLGAVQQSATAPPQLRVEQGSDVLHISAGVFLQANALLWQPLVEAVCSAATAAGADGCEAPRGRLIELFAGAGFFTLKLAGLFADVVAIESDARSVSDLRANLATGGVSNVEVVHAPVEEALGDALDRPDCVVLDPPRSGLMAEAVQGLAALDAQRIVYLSCDPATLARDLRLLCEATPGYRLTHVSAFDLFPQTPHVEALVVLER